MFEVMVLNDVITVRSLLDDSTPGVAHMGIGYSDLIVITFANRASYIY